MNSSPRTRRATAALACLASVLLIAVAGAAEPPEGSISKASPKIGWGGDLASSGIFANAWNNGQTNTPCEPPTCDPFTLTVSDAGPGVNLVIKTRLRSTAAMGNNGTSTLRVTDPAGKVTVYSGESGPETDLKTTIKNAANGKYQIDTTASFVCCGTSGHDSTAELTGAGFGIVAPPTTTTAPAPAPSETTPAPTLSMKVAAVSARKVKKSRKVVATLTASTKLSNVNLILVDKKKKLGSLKLASLEGTKKVTLKLAKSKARRLKKGKRYQLSAGGTDDQGRTAVTSVRVRVKK